MKYAIENEILRLTVNTLGAGLCSAIRKDDGTEHIWQGDPTVWKGQAPILFPYAGRLPNMSFSVGDKVYTDVPNHGFARNMEHTLVRQTENMLVFELLYSEETLKKWPFRFRLESTFLLEGDTLHHTLQVENLDEGDISFGIGFHPGFTVPFDDKHTYEDYELRFDKVESPICIDCNNAGGLLDSKTYYLGKNLNTIPLTDSLFAEGSHLMVGLQSKTLGLYERDTGRGVVCGISGFPFVLIWSVPGAPRFVCIEPWNSAPSPLGADIAWEKKPAAAILAKGEAFTTTMTTAFVR